MKIHLEDELVRKWLLVTILIGLIAMFLAGLLVGSADNQRVCYQELRLRDMALGKMNNEDYTYVVTNFSSGEYRIYNTDKKPFIVKEPVSLPGGG